MLHIIWDVDDVLNPLMEEWTRWLQKKGGITAPAYKELTELPPRSHADLAGDTYFALLDEFRLSGAYELLKPRPEILHWFQQEGHRAHHTALTAAPMTAAPHSAAWIMTHFGAWIRTFHVIPSPRAAAPVPTYDRTKGEYLGRTGTGDILIEDKRRNYDDARRLGMTAFLMKTPWNPDGMNPGEICRALTTLIEDNDDKSI
jgi:Mg2+ and Co2+ transporter CorA